jgi:hypothetical protein
VDRTTEIAPDEDYPFSEILELAQQRGWSMVTDDPIVTLICRDLCRCLVVVDGRSRVDWGDGDATALLLRGTCLSSEGAR